MPILNVPWSSRQLARSWVASGSWTAYAPALFFLFVSAHVLALAGERWVLPRVQDDAYYYLVIAKNIWLHGRSEFAPGVATNGYQPLWMLLVLVAGSIFGFTLTLLKALDLATIFAGFVLFVWLFGIREWIASVCYTMVLWYVLETCALNGMESSLLFPGFVLFIAAHVSPHPFIERHRAAVLFVASALCLGTRLDASLLLLPLLAVAPVGSRAKLQVVGGLALAGAAYAAWNYAMFATALPVSGAVKSLGGLQLNETYLSQVVRELDPARSLRMRSAATPYLTGVAVLGFALVLYRRRRAQLRLPLAMIALGLCGLALFGVRLTFFSSWSVWPWYGYPTVLFVLLAIWILERATPASNLMRVAQASVGLSLAVTQVQSALADRPPGFAGVSRQFIEEHAHAFAGEPVAMGDRAGSFGFDYTGGVYQLEGLVNDASYLDLLRTRSDLRAHLCQIGVPIVATYAAPLGDYREHRVEALLPLLTQHRGAYVTVHRSEEIASFEDLTQFDEPTRRIYAFRIDCDGDAGPSHQDS